MLPSHVAINTVSHSVCGPHNFPSSLKEGSHERMPMSWTLYLLWLSTGVLCKTWLKLRNDLSGNDKIYIERMNISAFFKLEIFVWTYIPNYLRIDWLWYTWSEARCRHCAINVTLYVFFFSSLPNFVPLLFIEVLTMWPRQRKHNPEQDSCLILLSTWYRLGISSLNKQFSFFVQIYVSIYVQRAYSYWMLKQNTTHNLIRNISIVLLSFLNAFNH